MRHDDLCSILDDTYILELRRFVQKQLQVKSMYREKGMLGGEGKDEGKESVMLAYTCESLTGLIMAT